MFLTEPDLSGFFLDRFAVDFSNPLLQALKATAVIYPAADGVCIATRTDLTRAGQLSGFYNGQNSNLPWGTITAASSTYSSVRGMLEATSGSKSMLGVFYAKTSSDINVYTGYEIGGSRTVSYRIVKPSSAYLISAKVELNGATTTLDDSEIRYSNYNFVSVRWDQPNSIVYLKLNDNAEVSTATTGTLQSAYLQTARFGGVANRYGSCISICCDGLFSDDLMYEFWENPSQILRKRIKIFALSSSAIELILANLSCASSFSVPELSQANTLVLSNLLSETAINNIDLSIAAILALQNLSVSESLSNIDLIQNNILSISSLASSSTLSNISLSQQNTISIQGLNSTLTLSTVNLTQDNYLTLSDLNVAQILSTFALVQANILALQNISQSQTIENIDLSLSPTLTISNLSVALSLGNISLVQQNTISLSNLNQNSSLSEANLITQNTISVENLSQTLSLDNLDLSSILVLTVQNLDSSSSLSSLNLSSGTILSVENLQQIQELTNILLSQHYVLIINNLLCSQILQNINLNTGEFYAYKDIFYILSDKVTFIITR